MAISRSEIARAEERNPVELAGDAPGGPKGSSARRRLSVVVPLLNDLPVRVWTEVGRLLLTVEVLSPSTEHADRGRKRRLYKEKAVPEYWIVNTTERAVERWRPDDRPVEMLSESLEWSPDRDVPPLLIDLPAYFDRVHGLA